MFDYIHCCFFYLINDVLIKDTDIDALLETTNTTFHDDDDDTTTTPNSTTDNKLLQSCVCFHRGIPCNIIP